MATTAFTIHGIKGRTASNRRFVVVDVRADLGKINIVFRTDTLQKALDRVARVGGLFVVDTIDKVKVRMPGSGEWVDA